MTERVPSEVLAEATERWVAAGVVTAEQRAAILALERQEAAAEGEPAAPIATTATGAPEREPRPEKPKRRGVLLGAEIAGYVGVAIIAASAGFALAHYWDDMRRAVQLVVVGLIAASLAGAAASISWRQDASVTRLANLLWLMATGAVAWFVGLFGGVVVDLGDSATVLVAAIATLVPASALLWWRRATLQHLAVYACVLGGVIAACLVAWSDHLSAPALGMILWGLGLVWCVVSWSGVLPHPRVGYALGAVTALVAPAGLADRSDDAAVWVGIATGAAILAAGVFLRSLVLVGLSIPGLFGYITAALGIYVGFERGSGLVVILLLLLLGLGVLATALLAARRMTHGGPGRAPPLPIGTGARHAH